MKIFTLVLAFLAFTLPCVAYADETANEVWGQVGLYSTDCATTAVNTGLGAGEKNVGPRTFHNNTSLLNCGAFYAFFTGITELLRHWPTGRRIYVGYEAAQEVTSIANNANVMKIQLGYGNKFWQHMPFAAFLKWDVVKF